MTHRILLADDSVTIRKVVELTFSDEDFTIDSVGDGAEAFEHARAERPDIVVSDVIMPGLNGYELCQRIKADPSLRTVPFLFLKGTFESFDEDKAHSCGADGFIVKPFESQELIARVRELIEGAALAPAHQHPRWESPSAPPVHPGAMPTPVVAPPAPVQPPVPSRSIPMPMPMPAARATPIPAPAYAPPASALRQPPAPPMPPAIPVRPAPQPPAIPPPTVRTASPIPPMPPRPVRPVAAPPPVQPAPPIPLTPPPPPEALAPPPPAPPAAVPPAAVHAPMEDFGFDFGETEADRAVPPAPRPAFQQPSAPAPEPPVETDEDLWSEVSLRDHTKDHLEVRQPAPTEAWTGAGIMELEEEAETAADEVVFEEVSTARIAPPPPPEASRVAAPVPVEQPPTPPHLQAPAVPPAIDPAEIERLVAARVEAAVRQVLEPVVKDLARAMIEEIAWDVIPGLAEAMIKSEIERIRQSTGTD